jgi:streptomycin 6-kinase
MKNLHSNIISIYGENGQRWLDNLPQTIEKLTTEFGLTDIQTGMKDVQLSFNYIFFAKYQGIGVVVKVSPKAEDSMREAEALKHFSGKGMPKLFANNNTTIIMERAIPGNILAKDDTVSLQIACGVMKKLHSSASEFDSSHFMDIEEWLAPIDQTWDFREDILQKAREYKSELLPKYTKRILLHGDLHYHNILRHGSSYIAIDPKGVIGHPINDIWNIIIDYEKDTKFIADYFGFDHEDLRKWYFVHVVLAICWCVEDNITPERFAQIADRIL